MELDEATLVSVLQAHPELIVQAGARRKLEWFAHYIDQKFQATRFHSSYYKVLDYFATGKIKKLIVQAAPQHGKALKIDTPVLTTKGWKRHIDLKAGDYVFGEDGKPKRVLWNSGGYIHECQEVFFADGFSLIAAREHEWVVYRDHNDKKGRRREVVETQNIFAINNRRSPYIKADAILDTEHSHLPIDPYLLGVWLGDGNKYDKWISCGEEDINHLLPYAIKVKRDKTAYRVYLDGLETKALGMLHLLYNKHIPMYYLLASREDRLRLLQGLMDTDGYTDTKGSCEFCQKSGQLAEDVYVLLRTLGYKPTKHEYVAYLYGKDCGKKTRIVFKPDKGDKIFDIPRKQERLNNKQQADREDKRKFFITSIQDYGLCEVNCIQVEDGIYLAGQQLVPTHNSQGSSRFLPAFMLGLNPELKVVIASYAATIAKDFNRDVQRIIDSPEYHSIFPETTLNNSNVVSISEGFLRNSDVFEIVNHKGSLRVVGRGGALTSKTADVIIYDDLYKDASEANSPLIREGAWDWYTKVARSRLHNNSQELIVFTRWHPEDIIGKIIESEQVIFAKKWSDFENVPDGAWVLVNFEAIKCTPPTEIDPREIGEVLWPERHSLERLESQRALDPVGFDCLYQGSPETAEGRLYQPFKEYSDKSEWGTYIRSGCYVDVADEGDDYLAAISYDIYKSNEQFFNERKQRFEPLLFALITDIEYTDAPTDVTTVTVPRLINANRVQKAWIESNNGGSQFEKVVKKKVRALTALFYQGSNKESRIVTNAPFVNQHIIFPVGWADRYPKAYKAITEFLRVFTANKHDDACLVAGTKIKTIFGDKPIEQIKKGDLVITPYGLNRVLDARCTGEKQVITKCGLRGTPNHKVFNKNSFDNLAGISENDISLCCFKSNFLWKYRILLYSMDKYSVLWGREGIILANQIQIKGERVLLDFMLRFGNFIIKGKFRKVIMFTIKTVTSLTMTFIIWSVYHIGNTYKYIIEKIRKIPNLLKGEKRIWQKGWRRQSDGTQAKKGENGIVSIQKPLIEHQDTKILVSSAEKLSNHTNQKQISVQTFAEKNIEVESCNTRQSVKIAEKNLNTEKQNQAIKTENFVQENVRQHIQTKTGVEKVYNLTVEKANCYYANGILVSNCDCLTGIYEKEIADGNTKPYGSTHRGIKVR